MMKQDNAYIDMDHGTFERITESTVLQAALELDQSKDPQDHLRARYVRMVMVPTIRWLDAELTRKTDRKLLYIEIGHVTGMNLAFLGTALGGGDAPPPYILDNLVLQTFFAAHAACGSRPDLERLKRQIQEALDFAPSRDAR